MKKPPAEVVASLLAVTTLFVPNHLPPWAIFISWAAAFAMGGPSPANLKRLWPAMPVGSIAGCLVVLGFTHVGSMFSGSQQTIVNMLILFCLNAGMMAVSRFVPIFSFTPGMFFGFATFFATMFGNFGPQPGDPVVAMLAAIVMNAIGPIYAFITWRCSSHAAHRIEAEFPHPASH
ncbi:MAG: DUF1097 domain-containing protein [Rhodocyclaceae bacterium]|nr:DUF1097 domain-containing protein [Rhodocyclaceae bacterium]